ncbi:MAG: hypothetical protein CMF51_04410 [Legionellales bacterium]|nr:hypothetical protein [Legionellales bacterium]
MKNAVIINKELDILKAQFFDHLKKFKNSMEQGEYFLVGNRSFNPIGWTDALRFFIEELQLTHSPIKDLVISSIYKINKECPLAVPLYFEVLSGRDISLGERPARTSSKDLIDQFRSYPDGFIRENLDSLLECLYLAGSAGTVSVEPTTDNPSIELVKGYQTLCVLSDFFEQYFESQVIEDCKLVIYNGAIIEVSEIHHILQAAYETKQKVIIVCSNLSEDVANTLFVNWQQGKTFVVPFLIEDSPETINEFRDIATISGDDLISRDSGLTLSGIKLEEKNAHTFTFDSRKGSLRLVTTPQESRRCLKLRSRILESMESQSVKDIQDIMRKRFSRMSGRTVQLNLNLEESEKGIIQDKSAAFFKYFSLCARQGVVKVKTGYGLDYLPYLEAMKAIRAAKHDAKCIGAIKAVVRIDE